MQYIEFVILFIVILFSHIIVCFVLEGYFLHTSFIIISYTWFKFFRPILNACCRVMKKRAPASRKLLVGIYNGVGNIVRRSAVLQLRWLLNVWQKSKRVYNIIMKLLFLRNTFFFNFILTLQNLNINFLKLYL